MKNKETEAIARILSVYALSDDAMTRSVSLQIAIDLSDYFQETSSKNPEKAFNPKRFREMVEGEHECVTLEQQRECAYGSVDAAYCTTHKETH